MDPKTFSWEACYIPARVVVCGLGRVCVGKDGRLHTGGALVLLMGGRVAPPMGGRVVGVGAWSSGREVTEVRGVLVEETLDHLHQKHPLLMKCTEILS